METADGGVLINRVLAMGNALHHEPVILRQPAAVGAGVLAVGAFVVNPALGSNDATFNDDLGVRRDRQVVGQALHQLSRRAIVAAQHLPVVRVHVGHHGRQMVQGRRADQDGNRHVLAVFAVVFSGNARAVGGIAHVDVGLVFGPVHKAVNALVGEPVFRVHAHDICVVQVSVAVLGVVMEQRKHSQVDIVAFVDDLLAGGAVDYLVIDAGFKALRDFDADLADIAAEREGVLGAHAVTIRVEGELTVLDLFHENGLVGVVLHKPGQLVYSLFLGDALDEAGSFHVGDGITKALLGHGCPALPVRFGTCDAQTCGKRYPGATGLITLSCFVPFACRPLRQANGFTSLQAAGSKPSAGW